VTCSLVSVDHLYTVYCEFCNHVTPIGQGHYPRICEEKICYDICYTVMLLTQGVAFCQLTSTSSSDPTPIVHRRVLIADSNSQCVQVFSATTGECLLKFGVRGRQASQLQRPTGMAVTANGNYLVSDYDNKWVGVFSPEGKYINRSAGLRFFKIEIVALLYL